MRSKISFIPSLTPRKSLYTYNKFQTRISRYGFSPKLYHYFIDLEEKFLPEEYHPFNNFFLFFYMRYVAFSNTGNKHDSLLVRSFTSSISKLVYHNYPTNAGEKEFVNAIQRFLSYFEKYLPLFKSENTEWSKHPARKEYAERHEADKKKQLMLAMDKMGIVGYDQSMSSEELMEYTNAQMEKVKNIHASDTEIDDAMSENAESSGSDDVEGEDFDGLIPDAEAQGVPTEDTPTENPAGEVANG